MRALWHDSWGCGGGRVQRLAPQVRLLAGAVLLAACMVAPTETFPGGALAAGVAFGWLCACRPPLKLVRIVGALAVAGLAPYFLMVQCGSGSSSLTLARSTFAVALGLFARGMSGLVVSVATISTVGPADLRVALGRLSVPAAVSAILLQIVHQAASLVDETQRVSSALAVRGASTRGRVAWRMLAALPQVWLPRVARRADRVAAAMELRGFGETGLSCDERQALGMAEALTLAVAVGVLVLAGALRCWSTR